MNPQNHGGILNLTEREMVAAHRRNLCHRRTFYTAGLHDYWAFDQHNKLKRFGIRMIVGVEPTSGEYLWLKVWGPNSNPRFTATAYVETARRLHGIPLLTMSDLGTSIGLNTLRRYCRDIWHL